MQTNRRWMFAALLWACSTVVFAQPAASPAAPPSPELPAHALNAADAEQWLDGFFPYALQSGDIAGAVVLIVKDGQVLLEKGFGYSDYARSVPVDPKSTLFRWGSVSKLYTWTAVMQLVEQGKIDLDADVNQYLDFKIPAREGKPVTMRNLMTHTAGFEERLYGLIGVEADGVQPLDQFIKAYIPERIFAPGGTPAYSNYGAALAGYIVARVSGMPFDDYIDQQLFKPLEMHDASFRQPLPAALKAGLSNAYAAASLPPKPYEIVGPAPAGSLAATADDMSHFMIAHLQNGKYGTGQILKPETAQEMHDTTLTILPRVNRMALGFYEDNYDGHRTIAHGGDTQWFHSDLHLFLDDGLGLLVSVNSLGKQGAAHNVLAALFHEFTDRYLPGPTSDGKVDAQVAAEHARMIAGRYSVSRRAQSSFVSLLYMSTQATVADNGDGTISLSSDLTPSGVPLRWHEIAPLIWRQEHGKQLLAARAQDGRIDRFSYGEEAPIEVYDRTPWSESSGWWVPALAAGVIALLLTALAWPLSALVRRHYRVAYALGGMDARAHRWVRIASAAAALVFLGWVILVVSMLSKLDLIPKVGGWLALLRVLSPIVFVAGAAIGLWNLWAVLKARRRIWAKLWAAVVAAALLLLLWAALAFHLIAFHSGF
ncbi:MAG TPA: serine hydrolase domain-containing protein [Steroidobacteraceae bacterium]|jgi:CubicO group peptidase (beta-lactamase class C family)|nr:serine hydrolase domain-containing protein [Steroidobacteraceae bacterium]